MLFLVPLETLASRPRAAQPPLNDRPNLACGRVNKLTDRALVLLADKRSRIFSMTRTAARVYPEPLWFQLKFKH